MAERLAYLEAVIGADITQFRKGMRDVRNEMGVLSETMQGMAKVGRTMTFALSVPLVTGATFAVQAASKYDAAMRNVASISSEVAGNFEEWSANVLDFGKSIREGPVAAADALYTVFSAGVTNTDAAMATMQASVATAEAGLADLKTTTEAMTSTMLGFNLEMGTAAEAQAAAERASNSLTRMVQLGVGEMNDFAHSMALAVPTAAGLGIEMEDLHANIALLTQRGFSASRANTALNAALSSLVKPTESMKGAFEELGVASGEELVAKFGGITGAMRALLGTTGGTSEELNKLFSTIRGARAVNAFTTDMEAWDEGIKDFYKDLDIATESARAEQMKSFAYQFDLLKASIQGVAIAVGQVLLPMLTPLIIRFTDIFNRLSETNPEVLKMAVAFGAVIAAAGPVIWLLSSLSLPLVALAAGVIALKTAWDTNWMGIQDTVKGVVETITGSEIYGKLQSMITTVTSILDGSAFAVGLAGGADAGVTGSANPFQRVINSLLPDEPIEISWDQIITVKEGDTVWDIFMNSGANKFWDWETFKTMVSAQLDDGDPAVIHPGDVIKMSQNWGIELGGLIGDAISGTGGGGGGEDAIQQAVVPPLLDRINMAMQVVGDTLGPEIEPHLKSIGLLLVRAAGAAIGGVIAGPAGAVIGGAISVPLVTSIVEAVSGVDVSGNDALRSAFSGIVDSIQKVLGEVMGGSVVPVIEDGHVVGMEQGGPLHTLASGLSEALETIRDRVLSAWDTVQSGLGNVFTGIAGFIENFLATVDEQAVSNLVSFVVRIGAGLGQMFQAVAELGISTITNLAETVLPLLGSALGNFVNAIGLLLGNDLEGAGAAFTAFLNDIIAAPVAVVQGLLAGIGEWFERTFGNILAPIELALLTAINDFLSGIQDFRNVIVDAFAGLGIQVDLPEIDLTDMAFRIDELNFQQALQAALATAAAGEAVDFAAPLEFGLETLGLESVNLGDLIKLSDQLDPEGALSGQIQTLLQTAVNNATTSDDIMAGIAAVDAIALAEALGLSVAMETAGTEAATAMTTSMSEGLGISSPSTVMQEMGLMLGAGLLIGLTEGFFPVMQAAAASFNGMQLAGTLAFNVLDKNLSKSIPSIVSKLDNLRLSAEKVASALRAVRNAAEELSQTNVPVPPSSGSVPGRAAGGSVMQGKTYEVEERESPEFFVPSVSGKIVPLSQMGANLPRGGGGNTSNYTTVQVGVQQSIDDVLWELERRGYKLERT